MDLPHLCYVFLACAIQGSNYLLSVETSCVRNAEIAEMRFRGGAGVTALTRGGTARSYPLSSGCAGRWGGVCVHRRCGCGKPRLAAVAPRWGSLA